MSAVLAVVLMVLKIIGMILLALLLLLLLALLLPAGIHFRWSHIGGLRLQLCYGPRHFTLYPVPYTPLRAHETVLEPVCRLLLEKKKSIRTYTGGYQTTPTEP